MMRAEAKAAPGGDVRGSLAGEALEAIPAGVLVLDRGGRVLLASSPVEAILGSELRNVHEETAAAEDVTRREALLALRHACESGEEVHQLITFDRERRHFVYLAAAPRDERGEDGTTVALLMDLTDVVARSDMAAEFVRQMRHDLRGPLTSLVGGIELLLTERLGRLDERQKRLLHVMEKGTRAMEAVVSRKTGGEVEYPPAGAPPEGED